MAGLSALQDVRRPGKRPPSVPPLDLSPIIDRRARPVGRRARASQAVQQASKSESRMGVGSAASIVLARLQKLSEGANIGSSTESDTVSVSSVRSECDSMSEVDHLPLAYPRGMFSPSACSTSRIPHGNSVRSAQVEENPPYVDHPTFIPKLELTSENGFHHVHKEEVPCQAANIDQPQTKQTSQAPVRAGGKPPTPEKVRRHLPSSHTGVVSRAAEQYRQALLQSGGDINGGVGSLRNPKRDLYGALNSAAQSSVSDMRQTVPARLPASAGRPQAAAARMPPAADGQQSAAAETSLARASAPGPVPPATPSLQKPKDMAEKPKQAVRAKGSRGKPETDWAVRVQAWGTTAAAPMLVKAAEAKQHQLVQQTDTNAKVQVLVRIRPMLGIENRAPEATSVDEGGRSLQIAGQRHFFDAVLGPQAPQEQLYESFCHPLVDAFLSGQNATILAYGQTGSGKTFTMGTSGEGLHTERERGCLPRVLWDVFDGLKQARLRTDLLYEVTCQFLEIYNEEIHDLLAPKTSSQSLKIREVADGGIVVTGLREVLATSQLQVLELFRRGCEARATGKTNVNKHSSRSHAVFTLRLKAVSQGAVVRQSKLHVVDLAGSERNKKTGAVGIRFKEAVNINKGLLSLGNVINALSDPKANAKHIPYRDSKITRLLQDSLGGDHKTCMIACVSPTITSLDETLNTLKYASRARNIRNTLPPPVPDEDKVIETLVHYCRGDPAVADDLPQDIRAAMTPAAVLKAAAALRKASAHDRKQLQSLADGVNWYRKKAGQTKHDCSMVATKHDKAHRELAGARSDLHRAAAEARLLRIQNEALERRVGAVQQAGKGAAASIRALTEKKRMDIDLRALLRSIEEDLVQGLTTNPPASPVSFRPRPVAELVCSHPVLALGSSPYTGNNTPQPPQRLQAFSPAGFLSAAQRMVTLGHSPDSDTVRRDSADSAVSISELSRGASAIEGDSPPFEQVECEYSFGVTPDRTVMSGGSVVSPASHDTAPEWGDQSPSSEQSYLPEQLNRRYSSPSAMPPLESSDHAGLDKVRDWLRKAFMRA